MKALKKLFGGLPPYDEVSAKKDKIEKVRLVTFLVVMAAVGVYFVIIDMKHPQTSLSQENPGTYVDGDSESHFSLPDTFFCIDSILSSPDIQFSQEIVVYEIGKYNSQGIAEPDYPLVKMDLPTNEYFSTFRFFYNCVHIVQNGSFFVSKQSDYWSIVLGWRITWKAEEASMDAALDVLENSLIFLYVNFDNAENYDILAAPTIQHMNVKKSGIIHGSKKTPIYEASYQFDSFYPIEPVKNCTYKPGYLCAFALFGVFYSVPQFTVQTVNLETNLQLAKRIITDICSLTGAVGMITIILFSRVISKMVLPNDQTFLIPHDTRDATLHLINKTIEERREKRDKNALSIDLSELNEVDDHFGPTPTDPLIS